MTQEAINQAKVLYHLTEDKSVIESLDALYHETPLLKKAMESKIVPCKQKEKILDDLAEKSKMSEKIKNYLKIMCRYGQIHELDDAISAYYQLWDKKHGVLQTELTYAYTPEQEEIEKATEFLKKKYPDKKLQVKVKENPSLLGGVFIQVGQEEYDWSYEGYLKQLENKLT